MSSNSGQVQNKLACIGGPGADIGVPGATAGEGEGGALTL